MLLAALRRAVAVLDRCAACLAFVASPLRERFRGIDRQAVARRSSSSPGPAACAPPAGRADRPRRGFQGALATVQRVDRRRRVYPTQARPTELPRGSKASVLGAGAPRPAGAGDPVQSRHWTYWPPRSP